MIRSVIYTLNTIWIIKSRKMRGAENLDIIKMNLQEMRWSLDGFHKMWDVL
jgi:hypothetical protein